LRARKDVMHFSGASSPVVTSAPAAIGDTSVQVVPKKLTATEVQGAALAVPGFVTVHGSGLYGPLLVSFCKNVATLPVCSQTTSVFAPPTRIRSLGCGLDRSRSRGDI
jgi:hypothetical protein